MLGVKLCNVKLDNPLILASGIIDTSPKTIQRLKHAGAWTIKSIGPVERHGNPNPSVYDWEHGLINAVGLPSSGYKNMDDDLEGFSKLNKPWIASFFGSTKEDYAKIAKFIDQYEPDLFELNLSCPNVTGKIFSTDEKLTYETIKAVKKVTDIPVIAKLTPNVTDIVKIAKACEEAGADAINAINTVLGMSIDIDVAKPVLGFKTGGVSGPAIKPIAIRCVYQIYENVKIPIIGTGGITTPEDAIEMMMAGATACGVGSAVYLKGEDVVKDITEGMEKFLKDNGYKSIKDIVGLAHD